MTSGSPRPTCKPITAPSISKRSNEFVAVRRSLAKQRGGRRRSRRGYRPGRRRVSRVDELFAVKYGHKLDMNKMVLATAQDGIAFVGRKGSDQGLSGYVAAVPGLEPYGAGMLTVALGGSRLLST